MRGRKPKPDGEKVTKHALTQEWVEIPNVRYTGPRPTLPAMPAATRRWWEAISTMPICQTWDEEDWQFAVDTAQVHQAFAEGKLTAAAELRVREARMGTTMAARRDLRIKYVDPAPDIGVEGDPAEIAEDEERFLRIVDAS